MIRTAKFGATFAAVALASACGTSTTGSGTTGATGATGTTSGTTTSTTSGTGTGTTSTSSSSSTSGTTGTTIYCNGIQFTDSANTTLFMATYPKADEVRIDCDHAIDPFVDAGNGATATLGAFSGVLDRNTYAAQGTLYTLWPADCYDLDAGPAPVAGTVVTDGGTTVAAALTAAQAGHTTVAGPVYGVVTFLTAPYTSDTGAHSGTMWIQDEVATGGTPAPNSGVSIYFPKASANDAGASGAGLYPAAGASLGDVVAFTNLTWSPYAPTGSNSLPQNQFEFGATATMTDLGAGTLPPAVALTGEQLSGDAGPSYMGMRVIQTDGPDTVVNSCPVALQSTASGG